MNICYGKKYKKPDYKEDISDSQKYHKKKKKKHKKQSSSDTDSSSSNSSLELLEKLKKERLKQAEEKQRRKELMKATETPEEKRIRRLRKKEAKERKRKELMGWDNEYLHYTNSDNPFGDGNLLSTFVWQKKMAREGLTDVSKEALEARNRFKQEENRRELEKVKKRRQERELERQQREDEMQLLQRNKEAAQFEEWERQEDQFHLEQARLRSHIRIRDGRAKPIDLLAKYISTEEDVDAVEMHEPYTYLNGLRVRDLEDLIEDIKVYKELEKGRNLDYWNDITVIVEDELQKLRKLESTQRHHRKHSRASESVVRDEETEDDEDETEDAISVARRRDDGIHQSVAKDVTGVFKGKTAVQLGQLQKNIEAKISGRTDGIDIGYWESLLSQLKAHMARARLRDRHQENLKRKLELLKAEQQATQTNQMVEKLQNSKTSKTYEAKETMKNINIDENQPGPSKSTDEPFQEENSMERPESIASSSDQEDIAGEMLRECFAAYDVGSYSPRLHIPSDLEPGTIVVLEADDDKRLEFAREQVLGTGKHVNNATTKEEFQLLREARKGMGEDEAEFSVESTLDSASQVYLWSDKYRPRKPRYFNRVHTGFEWNKYNQTHYDMDNPPPKIVQGYKFNIFYPDLIDKNSTPEYFLTPCSDNREFGILRFHAGPPYEDIAFKIVNREWEYSYKRGFRCQFHNNIFQLWFHFKRYRYRR